MCRLIALFSVPEKILVEKVHNVLYPYSVLNFVLDELSVNKKWAVEPFALLVFFPTLAHVLALNRRVGSLVPWLYKTDFN